MFIYKNLTGNLTGYNFISNKRVNATRDSYRDKNFQFFFASLQLCNFAFKITFFITNYCYIRHSN